jgi:hypothetical protein
MVAIAASRAEAAGPNGFSFASIITPPAGGAFCAARANIGSVTILSASPAEAAADKLKKVRRDAEGGRKAFAMVITHLVACNLTAESSLSKERSQKNLPDLWYPSRLD